MKTNTRKHVIASLSRKFTLMELLAVIAIIAILAAMLLPALNKARERTKTIKCASNLKQFGTAFVMYSDNYDGYLPALQNGAPLYGSPYWFEVMLPYVSEGIYSCPSAVGTKYAKGTEGRDNVGYGANINVIINVGLHLKSVKIKHPSQTIILGDGYGDRNSARIWKGLIWPDASLSPWCYDVDDRHSSGLNALYAAGQAAWDKKRVLCTTIDLWDLN